MAHFLSGAEIQQEEPGTPCCARETTEIIVESHWSQFEWGPNGQRCHKLSIKNNNELEGLKYINYQDD